MSLLFAELTATCNALGYAVAGKNKYLLDNECQEAIRELIRFLRRDDGTHEIRRYLGTASILQTDLVPILIHRHSNEEILDLLLRLLVNLTTPALLLYNEEVPTEKTARQYYQTIVQSLQAYKQAFADKSLWTVLSEKLTSLLALEWADRGQEKSMIIVRILILVRNILHVPVDVDFERRPDNDASTHDQVLWALHEGGMINLILYIAASENEQQYYFHVLEIISLMLRDHNAEVLASASVQRSDDEKQRDVQELMAVRKKEVEDKQKKLKTHIAARHSRFGGTFVVKGVKSISDNDLVVHSLNNQITAGFDKKKHKLKTPKNRLPMQGEVVERRSAFSVRVLMKEFCIEFLNGAYNSLMRYIREMLARGKTQANDESYYFWAMRFFMQFNRCYKFEVKLISETMSVQIFHFIQERLEDWRANLTIDKKKIHLWSKRMHLALKAYQELLNTLMRMYQSSDATVRESAHTIMSNIFYIVEYRELLMSLLNLFDEIKFSKEYLKDLIESNHVFIKMLEHYCKRHRSLVVQKKPKVVKRKKKPKKSAKQTSVDLSAECTEEKWTSVESRLIDIMDNGGDLTTLALPFDAASDVPMEEQKVEAMRKIRLFLVKGQTEEAIGLFRASREVWPENDCFGSANMSANDERGALKDIFLADIGFPTDAYNLDQEHSEDEEESERSENEEDAQVANIQVSEQNFQFEDFIKKFAKPKIVRACCLLLNQFEKNTTFTNHCVLKLLHRIAFDCKYAAILFQASVFRTFQRILDSTEEQHKELKKFAVFIVRKFIEVAKKNDKVYIELLFWKGHKEAYEIEEGYGSLTTDKSTKVAWTEEQEDELRRLFAEYENNKPEQDVIDWIHANLINQSRSRKSLIHKLRELYLITGPQKRKSSTKPPKEFSEAEVAQITQLFNEFREAYDIMGCIMDRLDVQRPKNRIVDKILELGLVQSKSELRKKKISKNKSVRVNDDSDDSIIDSDEDSSDSENEHVDRNGTHEVKSFNAHSLSSEEVISNVKAISSSMKEALDWIESTLNEVLEDLGDDESDVPILPLADYSVTAMDDPNFQKFLKSIGIKPPSGSQETYWRIPGVWQANDIRKRIYLMKMALNENQNGAEFEDVIESRIDSDFEEETPRFENETEPSSSRSLLEDSTSHQVQSPSPKTTGMMNNADSVPNTMNDVGKKRKRFDIEKFNKISEENTKKKRIRRIADFDDEDDNASNESVDGDLSSKDVSVVASREHETNEEYSKSKKVRKFVELNDDKDSDDDLSNGVTSSYDDSVITSGNSKNSENNSKRKRIKRIVDPDDEDHDARDENVSSSNDIETTPFNKQALESDDESETGSSLKKERKSRTTPFNKQALESDDESETESSSKKERKSRTFDDSEDSDMELLTKPFKKPTGLDSDSD